MAQGKANLSVTIEIKMDWLLFPKEGGHFRVLILNMQLSMSLLIWPLH